MNYLSISQYMESVSDPVGLFRTLNGRISPELSPSGEVVWLSGNYAVVFRVRVDGRKYSLRCLLREQNTSFDRLRYVSGIESPYMRHEELLEDEIFVYDNAGEGRYYPVILSEWVEGCTLGLAVARALYAGNTATLHSLRLSFTRLALWLLEQEFAHGDVKPDNIIIRESDASPVLIDYDGMYIPGFAPEETNNIGSVPFQHPSRSGMPQGKYIDDYPIALLSVILHTVCSEPGKYRNLRDSDLLLFSPSDIIAGRSARLRNLEKRWAVSDPPLAALCGMLKSMSPELPGLMEVLREIIDK